MDNYYKHIKEGQHYMHIVDKDIVCIESIDWESWDVTFKIVEDRFESWYDQDDLRTLHEWDIDSFDNEYTPVKSYNTPLYKVING
jgi:hypothetical protein